MGTLHLAKISTKLLHHNKKLAFSRAVDRQLRHIQSMLYAGRYLSMNLLHEQSVESFLSDVNNGI